VAQPLQPVATVLAETICGLFGASITAACVHRALTSRLGSKAPFHWRQQIGACQLRGWFVFCVIDGALVSCLFVAASRNSLTTRVIVAHHRCAFSEGLCSFRECHFSAPLAKSVSDLLF
jgi:hypothetical protein